MSSGESTPDTGAVCDGYDDPAKRCGRHHATGLASITGGYECCCGRPWANKQCSTGAKAGEAVRDTGAASELRDQLIEKLNSTIVDIETGDLAPAADRFDRHDRHRFLHNCVVCGGDVAVIADTVMPVVEQLAEERDAARLVSKGRTMEHYDAIERYKRAEAALEQARALHDRTCPLKQAIREHPEEGWRGATCGMCAALGQPSAEKETHEDPVWLCCRCGSARWVAAFLTGFDRAAGQAIKQCAFCDYYSNDPVTDEDCPAEKETQDPK